jgi:hypothetical protein
MGGETSVDYWVTQAEMARDPENAPAMRPHVAAACQQLRFQPPLRLHCTCGRGLEFLALITLNGVLVVSSPRRVPKSERTGGVHDLAALDDSDPDAAWTYADWARSMQERVSPGAHSSSWQAPTIHPVLGPGAGVWGDAAKRQTFVCKCGATHTFLNVRLLRLVLEAIAGGQDRVRLQPEAHAVPLA